MGIQSKNRQEWVITNIAGMFQKTTSVALYDTLGPDAIEFVCNQTEMTSISISKDYIAKLSQLKIDDSKKADGDKKMHRLKNLIVFEDDFTNEDKELATSANINLFTMQQVIETGRQAKKDGQAKITQPEPDDVYMFSYTSGTTGDPKGVKLTHKMVVNMSYAF